MVPYIQNWCSFDNTCVWKFCFTIDSDLFQFHSKVVRAAEDTASSIAKSIPPEDCISILSPIILNEQFPINLAAIKMLNKVR